MKNKLLLFFALSLLFVSCSKDEIEPEPGLTPEPELTLSELNTIDYFKEIALGFEFGDASKITRKWDSDLNVFIGGEPSPELLMELETIQNEINGLATDGFKVNVVNDSLQSNYYIFFGRGHDYAELFPYIADQVDSNWGLFSLWWNGQDHFTRGHMYVDMIRNNPTEQKHILREELTQSLGLAQDSPLYQESMFQIDWTTTTEYAPIDKELIRLLYHPDMNAGMDEDQVDEVLRAILISE